MKHDTAVKAKKASITTMLILIVWAMGHLKLAKDSIVQNPDTVGLAFLLAYGLPIFILLIASVYYSVQAKKTEYDDLDD